MTTHFTPDQIGEQVGDYAFDDGDASHSLDFETNDWDRSHTITPGTYPVILGRYQNGFRLVTETFLTPREAQMGGSMPGADARANQSSGVEHEQASTCVITLAFAYSLDDLRMPAQRANLVT